MLENKSNLTVDRNSPPRLNHTPKMSITLQNWSQPKAGYLNSLTLKTDVQDLDL